MGLFSSIGGFVSKAASAVGSFLGGAASTFAVSGLASLAIFATPLSCKFCHAEKRS